MGRAMVVVVELPVVVVLGVELSGVVLPGVGVPVVVVPPVLLVATTGGDGSLVLPEPPPQAAKGIAKTSDASPAALIFFMFSRNNCMHCTRYFL